MFTRSFFLVLLLLLCCFSGLLVAQQNASTIAGTIDYQRVVRPILSDNCYHCHGPDQNTRMADLRLDTREGAFAKREGGIPVVPGNPQASLLYQRIVEQDPSRRMPPEFSHKVLTAAQKEILKGWIQQGAPWKEHWSFIPPVRPAIPSVKQQEWVRNSIDAFILSKLESAGLQPAAEADRRTLIRRVSLDLAGLPPTPEEVEAFVADGSPNAYEKVVDRLLSSPHWGEHRGRYWLDAARYADTHGIHIDNYREMWPYRDWVIQAFNRNLPFDQFTIEQIAGDVLPNRTLENQVASGFHRCNVTTNEAGIVPEEFEAIYAKDRVDTTGTVWLGLTVGCATCHDHKFDPISTKDFYSMTAFFRNTTQNVMDGNIIDTPPVVVVPRPEDAQRWTQLGKEQQAIEDRMSQIRTEPPGKAFDKWLRSDKRGEVSSPTAETNQYFTLSLKPAPKVITGGNEEPLLLVEGVRLGEGPRQGAAALFFGANAKMEIPGIDFISADKPFSISTWVYFPKNEDNFVVASQTNPDDKDRGWSIDIAARIPSIRLTADDGKSMTVRGLPLEQLKPDSWNHFLFTYDGSREQPGMAFYLNGRAIPTQGNDLLGKLAGEIRTGSPLRFASDGAKRSFQNGGIAEFRISNRALTKDEALVAFQLQDLELNRDKPAESLTEKERTAFHLFYLHHHHKKYRTLAANLQKVTLEQRSIRRRGAVTHVMQERTDSAPVAHILYRGQYDQPKAEVGPNVPAVLPPMPASFPRNRLGLAKWLVDSANPLTPRVTVNRFWQEVFGTGIVKTSEDFGSQGQPPSHPELLDWLAIDFRDSGWDIKRLFRLIVTSSAYRQSSLATEEKLKVDPENRLLSRGPRFRMDAEMVRDYALAASGLLAPKIGGPSVKPYQPEGIWEAVAMTGSNTRFYQQDHGTALYRRSLYTFWKRSAPPATMEIFGAPTRESCSVRRERTNTPLQALVVMNDPQFVEAARFLAERALNAGQGDVNREMDFITNHLLSRIFKPQERQISLQAYDDYLKHFEANPDEARKLLSVGESKYDEHLAMTQMAALTMVANQVMNLDEGLNK